MRPGPRRVNWRSVGPIVLILPLALLAAGLWYWQERGDRLDETEVRRLLAGNTAAGAWGDARGAYRQYFDPDGTTVYLRRDAAVGPLAPRGRRAGLYRSRSGRRNLPLSLQAG